MALLKALQKQPLMAEHEEYITAMLVYKAACKRYAQMPKEFENSSRPLERLQFGDEQRRYKAACKEFHAVRRRWILAKARTQLGANMTPDQMTELLQLDIPSTMDELLKDAKEQARADIVSDEQFEAIRNELETRTQTTKEMFLKKSDNQNINPLRDEDETLDDTPLL